MFGEVMLVIYGRRVLVLIRTMETIWREGGDDNSYNTMIMATMMMMLMN